MHEFMAKEWSFWNAYRSQFSTVYETLPESKNFLGELIDKNLWQ